MVQFSPDQVTFGDPAGMGMWDIGHGREHSQFVAALAARSPPVVIADYPLLSLLLAGSARKSIVESHMQAHYLIRQATGVSGVDYSVVNFDDEGSFYDFLTQHANEHAQIRQALGL